MSVFYVGVFSVHCCVSAMLISPTQSLGDRIRLTQRSVPGCEMCMFTCRQERDACCLFWLCHTPWSKPRLYANTVRAGHLFNSAHLNYFLAPSTYPDCLSVEPFKTRPTFTWQAVSKRDLDKRGYIKITSPGLNKQFRVLRSFETWQFIQI